MARLLSRLPHRLALASLLALSLLLNACGPTDRPRVTDYRSQGELRVATRHDAISYRIDDEGHASGFEHELLLALGDALGVPDHAEQRDCLLLIVYHPIRIENLVTAMFGVRLRKHH